VSTSSETKGSVAAITNSIATAITGNNNNQAMSILKNWIFTVSLICVVYMFGIIFTANLY